MATFVRLISAAVEDLILLQKQDPQLLREALKKCLLSERSAMAGEPLLGALIGLRKLKVGDWQRRIVWRVRHEGDDAVVEIAEVWAVGWREDTAVYEELERRLAQLGDDPVALPLSEVIASLGRHVAGIDATPEPAPIEPVPKWIRNGLVSAGMALEDIEAMSSEEALRELQQRWGAGQ